MKTQLTIKKRKKKSTINTKIKVKNDGENDWPKNCVLCCHQKIEEINNYYFKDIEINNGKEVKSGEIIEKEVELLAKDKFDFSCEDNIFFINYEIKHHGIDPLNKEKNGTICIAYNLN